MTTKTLTLTEFLLARLTDDEHLANLAASVTDGVEDDWQDVVQPITVTATLKREDWAKKYGYAYQHIYAMSPARVLAEVEAKRRIVERAADYDERWALDEVLRLLSLPYADHPDYRDEWAA